MGLGDEADEVAKAQAQDEADREQGRSLIEATKGPFFAELRTLLDEFFATLDEREIRAGPVEVGRTKKMFRGTKSRDKDFKPVVETGWLIQAGRWHESVERSWNYNPAQALFLSADRTKLAWVFNRSSGVTPEPLPEWMESEWRTYSFMSIPHLPRQVLHDPEALPALKARHSDRIRELRQALVRYLAQA